MSLRAKAGEAENPASYYQVEVPHFFPLWILCSWAGILSFQCKVSLDVRREMPSEVTETMVPFYRSGH